MIEVSDAAVRMLRDLHEADQASTSSTTEIASLLDQYSDACASLTTATEFVRILSWPGNLDLFSAVSELKVGRETGEVFRDKLSQAYGLYREWLTLRIQSCPVWSCNIDEELDAFWQYSDSQGEWYSPSGQQAGRHRRYFQLVSIAIGVHRRSGESVFLQALAAYPDYHDITGLAFRTVWHRKLWLPENLEAYRTGYYSTLREE